MTSGYISTGSEMIYFLFIFFYILIKIDSKGPRSSKFTLKVRLQNLVLIKNAFKWDLNIQKFRAIFEFPAEIALRSTSQTCCNLIGWHE